MGSMSTQTITEFLEARIGEDEAVARKCEAATWKIIDEDGGSRNPLWVEGLSIAAADSAWDACIAVADAAHVTRHDPARVLAECAAKRAIIEEHELGERSDGIRASVGCVLCNYNRDYGWDETGPCKTLRALAAVYADHADYQQEWAL